MQYNQGTGLIQLMTLTNRNSKSNIFTGRGTNYYIVLMTTIDPATLAITSSKPITTNKADAYVKTNLKNPKGYFGLPQDMIINNDKTTTVLLEEMVQETISNGKGAVSYRTYLNDIGVAKYDVQGNEVSGGYAVNKAQMANGRIDPLYISKKSNGYWSIRANTPQGITFGMGVMNNNAFLSYDYINTGSNEYIFYNDYPENLDRKESKKPKTVVYISDANTVMCKVNGDNVDKSYLFGTPDDSHSRFCYIESSHFLKENKTYATLMIDKDDKKKQAKVAWITLR